MLCNIVIHEIDNTIKQALYIQYSWETAELVLRLAPAPSDSDGLGPESLAIWSPEGRLDRQRRPNRRRPGRQA